MKHRISSIEINPDINNVESNNVTQTAKQRSTSMKTRPDFDHDEENSQPSTSSETKNQSNQVCICKFNIDFETLFNKFNGFFIGLNIVIIAK